MSAPRPHRVGETLVGRYRLISPLGRGGYGEAFRAWDDTQGVPVVLKMPLAKHLDRPVVLERFSREVARLRACSHANIVPIIDDGQDNDGRPFIVMRFLPGGSLADRKKPVGLVTLHRWLPGIAAALDYIHSQGVLHRDVKPSNIFFDTQTNAFLGDFGVARVVDEEHDSDSMMPAPIDVRSTATPADEESLTATGQLMGTLPYMAPELFEERPRLSPLADQYSLAVAVYELLSKSWPVKETDRDAFRRFHRSGRRSTPLSARIRNVPASLANAVAKALEKSPDDRFGSCREFAAAVLAEVPFTPLDPSQHRFLCPQCKRLVRVPDDFAGRSCRCPGCNITLRVTHNLDALWRPDEDPRTASPGNHDTGISLSNLAISYHNQGKYDLAEPLYMRALAINETAHGPDHPSTATSLSNLAISYHTQGKYELAEPLFRRALAIRKKALGPDHPDTAQSLSSLAVLYYTQGKYHLAEPLYKRAWAIRAKTLGPDHPDTATSLNSLAVLYYTQGEYDLAEPLYKRALAIREKTLGPDHPDTAQSLSKLARLYYTQGKYDLTEPLLKRTVAIKEKAAGPAAAKESLVNVMRESKTLTVEQARPLAQHEDDLVRFSGSGGVLRRPSQAYSEPVAEGRFIELPFFGPINSGKTYLVTAAVHAIRLMTAQLGGEVLVNGATKANEAIAEYEKRLFDPSSQGRSPQDWLSLPMTGPDCYLSKSDDSESRAEIWEPAEYSLMLQEPYRASNKPAESTCLRLYDHPGNCGWNQRSDWEFFDWADHWGGIKPSFQDVCDRATAVCMVVDLTCEPKVAGMCCEHTTLDGDLRPARHGTPWFVDFRDGNLEFANSCIWHVRLGRLARDKACPLFVVLSKFDQWGSLIGGMLPSPARVDPDSMRIELDVGIVRAISDRCSALIHTYCPQLASVLAQLPDECPLIFIPCTATGHGATLLEGKVHHRVSDIKPAWAEVPLLLALSESPRTCVIRTGGTLW